MIKIAILSTGDELLHGDIVDTNTSWLARSLFSQGMSVSHMATVADNVEEITHQLQYLSQSHQVIIVNGGLGATTDDVTAEAAAKANDTGLVLSDQWLQRIEQMYQSTGKAMPDSNIKQALLPENCSILDNPIGTACGFHLTINNASCFFTPGVPKELKLMFEQQILPALRHRYPALQATENSRIYTFGLSESEIADLLDPLELAPNYSLGFRSELPFIEIKLYGPANDMDTRMQLLGEIYPLIADYVVGIDETMLDNLAMALTEANQSITVAEQASCGYLSYWLHSTEAMHSRIKQTWVSNEKLINNMITDDPIANALALAATMRTKNKVNYGISCSVIENNSVAIGLSTVYAEWGQIVRFTREYTADEQQKLISAVMLDMVRRHIEQKSLFGNYSHFERIKELHIPSSALGGDSNPINTLFR